MPDFEERVNFYRNETEKYGLFIADHAKVERDVIVIDLRGEKIYRVAIVFMNMFFILTNTYLFV